MKKLIFSALVAVVAVGGAFVTKAGTIYEGDDSNIYHCDGPSAPLCTTSDFPAGVQIREQGTSDPYQFPSQVLTDSDFKLQ